MTVNHKLPIHQWNWGLFKGSQECLKWARRDLETLEKALLYVPGRKACVQAGGNLGIFPKRLALDFEIVYTFEPSPILFEAMRYNASEPNILGVQAALGDNREPVRVECKRRDDTGRPVHEGLTYIAGPGSITCMKLDDLDLAVCDLIYLDVEGWEYRVLVGARETIERCRPVIGVEINRNIGFAGRSAEELRALIISYGYEHRITMHSDEIYLPT